MSNYQRPGGPRRAKPRDKVHPSNRPPLDDVRNKTLDMAQTLLADDATTSLVESRPYEPNEFMEDAPRAAPASDWMADAANIEDDPEPEVDVHAAQIAAEASSEIQAKGAGAVGEEVRQETYITTKVVPDVQIETIEMVGIDLKTGLKIRTDNFKISDAEPVNHLKKMIDASAMGLAVGDATLQWAIEEIMRLRMGGAAPEWNLDMAAAPDDGTPIIAMGRYADKTAGSPRIATYLAGAWRESGRSVAEPLVVWGWISRDVLPEWPVEPA